MAKAASGYANAGLRRSARHTTASDKTENEVFGGASNAKERKPSKAIAAVTTKRVLASDSPSTSTTTPRKSKRVKIDKEIPEHHAHVKSEQGKAVESPERKRIKHEDEESSPPLPPSSSPLSSPAKSQTKPKAKGKSSEAAAVEATAAAADLLQSKKLKSYSQFAAARQSPYPDFPHPTASEAKLAHRILSSLHGERVRPAGAVEAPKSRSGCGDSPSVLDALIRTILSQNTSDANSSRAKLAMDRVYGSATATADPTTAYTAIVAGGQEKLAKTIESGGLAVVKSKVILSILEQTREKYGCFSLDHLFHASDEDAMKEMLAFKGVGPKTASCVLLFCLRRPSFAVDTHVHRITGLLGWRPASASRDQNHAHLDARLPDEDKYGLHVLLVKHGKVCAECRAGGKSLGKCELRRAFRKGKGKGEMMGKGEGEESVGGDDGVKEEEEEKKDIKTEGDVEDDVKV
ncbi:DNA glycosylase [Xylaria arbuscula]|nr:DNA glycosylase [Xylaria arbuscula]